ncbi:MAG: pyridoxal phosphate-dependent aminotransferase [Planctomycetes bacterium]|nr:pyridoxal phosphate-dependent aminotransferase [Planctomycetota bacterium]
MSSKLERAMDERWFPYMCFARREAMSSRFSLCGSGMPAADRALFESVGSIDLEYAGSSLLPQVRQRIAARYAVAAEDVFVTPGASGAMAIVAAALFGPGVRVAVECPSYEPLRALPRRSGAEVVELERSLERDWSLDLERAARALEGARPGFVFLSTPHNPSGQRTAAADLRELARMAARTGGALISNEIYEEFVPPERAFRAARELGAALSIGSLTKAYGLGALRVGWVVLGSELSRWRARFEDALFLDCVDLPTASLRAALRAFDVEAELRRPLGTIESGSKPMFDRWLAASKLFRGRSYGHGLTAFVRAEGVRDTRALARHLAETEDLGVVPGEYFGAGGYLRLGCGVPPEHLEESLARLDRGRETYSGT